MTASLVDVSLTADQRRVLDAIYSCVTREGRERSSLGRIGTMFAPSWPTTAYILSELTRSSRRFQGWGSGHAGRTP